MIRDRTSKREAQQNVEQKKDTSIGHIAQDESTLRNMINTDLNRLKKWSNRRLLKFNPTKTEIIIFNFNGVECNLTFNFDQTTIYPVHTHKHLGIVFSSDCKWTKHIDKFIESASKQLIFMYSEN